MNINQADSDTNRILQNISSIIPKSEKAYIVGGTVRDILLGKTPADYDIAVLKNPREFAEELSQKINGFPVKIGKKEKTLFKVASRKCNFDVTRINGESIYEDIKKRDFTVNALAYDFSSQKIIDIVQGSQDIEKRIIRMVSEDIFRNDSIRLVRAFRIASMLDFKIDSHTLSAITMNRNAIKECAAERIRAELLRLFAAKKSHYYLTQMEQTNLIFKIFPELETLKNFAADQIQQNIFNHSMQTYFHLEEILNDSDSFFFDDSIDSDINKHFTDSKKSLLKCAALLHDIAKPYTYTKGENSAAHFYKHDSKGAEMSVTICERLKFSNREKKYIESVIRNHLRPLHLFLSSVKEKLTSKGTTRFFLKCGDMSPDLLIHSIADFKAKKNDPHNERKRFIQFAKQLIFNFYSDFLPEVSMPPLITGNDIIREFGLSPSPAFKTIIRKVKHARLANIIKTKSEALQFVQDLLDKVSK